MVSHTMMMLRWYRENPELETTTNTKRSIKVGIPVTQNEKQCPCAIDVLS